MATVTEILTRHLNNLKDRVAQRMADEGRNVSGRSVSSLSVDVSGNVGALYGGKQFLVMERGRSAGKVPLGFVDIIKKWIKDKGIAIRPIPSAQKNTKLSPEERGLNSLAGAITFSIMKKGTRLHREKGFNDIYSSAITEELDLMAAELVDFTSKSINDINKSIE